MKRTLVFYLFILLGFHSFAQKKLITENVVLITVDGLRWQEVFSGAEEQLMLNKTFVSDPLSLKNQFWSQDSTIRRELLMPFFWSTLKTKGQLYGNRHLGNKVDTKNKMGFSYPGYSEILCGFADDARIKSNNKIDNPNKNILEFISGRPNMKGKVAAFCSWDVFPFIINEGRSGIPVNAGFDTASVKLSEKEKMLNELQRQVPSPWPSVRLDAFTHHYAREYVRKNSPRLLFISYGETDDFAHDGKYDAYLRSANRTDQFVADLWNYLQSIPQYKDKTTFVITTDHGRGTAPIDAWRNHGAETAGSYEIWLAVIGPDTPALGEVKEPMQHYQDQIAASIATFFNIQYTNEPQPGEAIKKLVWK